MNIKDILSPLWWIPIGAARAVVTVVGLAVVPIALLFTEVPEKVTEWRLVRLPLFAHPWDNPKDGVLGDRRLHYWNQGDQFPGIIKNSPFLKAYWWLAIRNPANNFSRFYRGIGCKVDECKVKLLAGQDIVGGSKDVEGYQFVKAEGPIFNYYGFYLYNKKFTMRFGHKVEPKHNEQDFSNDPLKAWKGVTFRITLNN